MIKYDEVGSLSKKLKRFFFNLDTTTFLILMVGVGVISLVFGAMNHSLITGQTIIIAILTAVML